MHGPRNVKTSANLALVYTQRQLHSSHGLTGKASLPLFLFLPPLPPLALGPSPTKKAQLRAYYNADSISPPTFFLPSRSANKKKEKKRRYLESLIRLPIFLPRVTVAVKCLFFPSDSFLLLLTPPVPRKLREKILSPLFIYPPIAQQPRKKDLRGRG